MELMRLIDEQYTQMPFYGNRKMTRFLRQLGYPINHKRISRLMRLMGLECVFPGPSLSKKHPEHRIYPYLLRGVEITDCDQVWSADITYIRLGRGFLYLVAIIDWFSRFVIAWRLSNTLDVHFCLEMLQEALSHGQPAIFNTDQGSQFTSNDFTGMLADRHIDISMDGRGRCFDNIFIERFWRSLKYEEVYLNDYQTPHDAYVGLKRYFELYNHERLHQSLNYQTPATVYKRARDGFSEASEGLSSDVVKKEAQESESPRQPHRLDEPSPIYSLVSCTPAELTST